MRELIAQVAAELARGEVVELCVLDPDRGAAARAYPGDVVDGCVHRPWRVWSELAERLGARLLTPRAAPDDGFVIVRLAKLAASPPPPARAASEKYGADSEFARIHKLEDPGFVIDLREALARCALAPDASVLAVGVNRGDELELVYEAAPAARVTGVDHAASALAVAAASFPRATFVTADVATLRTLGLPRFDLILSIDTLQSSGLDDRALLRTLVQDHLAPTGAVILGLPNSRYVAGELVYGARMLNFAQPELGLLVKDVAFYRKYLQQHRRQVFVTGKHELWITAVVRE